MDSYSLLEFFWSMHSFACLQTPSAKQASLHIHPMCPKAHDSHAHHQDMTRVNSWSLPCSKSSLRSVITDVPCMRAALPSTRPLSKPSRSANMRNTTSKESQNGSKIWLQHLPDSNVTSTTPQAHFPQQPQKEETVSRSAVIGKKQSIGRKTEHAPKKEACQTLGPFLLLGNTSEIWFGDM